MINTFGQNHFTYLYMNPEDINYDIMHSILTLILTYWQTGVWHLYWHNHWHIVWPVAWHPLWHIFRHWSEPKYQHLIWQTSCDIDSEWFWRVFCNIFWHLTGQVFHVTLIWRHISICSDGTWCFVWCASHPMIGPYWPHIGPIWPHMAPWIGGSALTSSTAEAILGRPPCTCPQI